MMALWRWACSAGSSRRHSAYVSRCDMHVDRSLMPDPSASSRLMKRGTGRGCGVCRSLCA
jgi:hypothetical protein